MEGLSSVDASRPRILANLTFCRTFHKDALQWSQAYSPYSSPACVPDLAVRQISPGPLVSKQRLACVHGRLHEGAVVPVLAHFLF